MQAVEKHMVNNNQRNTVWLDLKDQVQTTLRDASVIKPCAPFDRHPPDRAMQRIDASICFCIERQVHVPSFPYTPRLLAGVAEYFSLEDNGAVFWFRPTDSSGGRTESLECITKHSNHIHGQQALRARVRALPVH